MSSIPWTIRPRIPSHGVTLIELMIGLAIAAILATLSAPAFLRQINSSRLDAASSDLMATLARARGEALRTGMRVTVCRSSDGSTCDTGTPARWDLGWITFQDTNGNNVRDSGEALLSTSTAMSSQITAVGNSPIRDRISFRPSGSTSVAGTLRVCNSSRSLSNDQRAHDLIVIMTGRVVLERAFGVAPDCPAA